MNQEVKKRWIEALRSGEYKQTKHVLKDNHGFCCLGVLCDLYAKEKNVKWIDMLDYYKLDNGTDQGVYALPEEVQAWAGINSCNPSFVESGRGRDLAMLNDTLDYDFNQIAQAIDIHL